MKIGLLPLYVEMYDKNSPHVRPRLDAFYEEIVQKFIDREVEVVSSPFCRLKTEFKETIAMFEEAKVDAIVTMHMAYSPSLESIEALAETKLPIVVLDTTQTFDFSPEQSPSEIMYCHGIHGVMDMCSMLRRYEKPYAIAAGHYLESDCIERVCGFVQAAKAANALSNAKVGLVGGAFDGMGDFIVSREELKERFGITIEDIRSDQLQQCRTDVSQAELECELETNRKAFTFDEEVVEADYEEAVLDGLALRSCIQQNGYTAFSLNFQKVGEDAGIETMPFMECCKGMERGLGYAGEGDALTAAFTGALLSGYPETGFVEIFCPDWKNNTLFLSHMGEVNYRTVAGKPYVCRKGKPGLKRNAYAAYGCMQGGEGVFVNISRGPKDYRLVIAQADMISVETDAFPKAIRGWMKPKSENIAEFLEAISNHGATHHSIFVYGAKVKELKYFGDLLQLETIVIE